jgi:hypothetical protein
MSTITKTNFGQISFITTIEGVRFKYLGHGKCASKCNITDEEGLRFSKVDMITCSTYAQKLKMAWDVKN